MWLQRTSGFVISPPPRPVSQTSRDGLQEDEWEAGVVNLSGPTVNPPESASEKAPALGTEVACTPTHLAQLQKPGGRLPFCVCCKAWWPLIILPAKRVPFLEPH